MGLVKCPRCELNYIQEGEKYCTVCRRDIRGENDSPDIELCTACGERPAALGEDLCTPCLREIHRTEGLQAEPDNETDAETAIDAIPPSDIDEMELDIEEAIPSEELGEIDQGLSLDDEEIVPESLEELGEKELNQTDEDED